MLVDRVQSKGAMLYQYQIQMLISGNKSLIVDLLFIFSKNKGTASLYTHYTQYSELCDDNSHRTTISSSKSYVQLLILF